MPRCEDYPCCGHTPGDPCPTRDRSGNIVARCVECGGRLKRGARSSICDGCMSAALDREASGLDMWPERETDY